MKPRMYLLWIFVALLGANLIAGTEAWAQSATVFAEEEETEEEKQRRQLLREMENYLQVATDAGFTEDELKEITIERDGETIYVWDFVERERQRIQKIIEARDEARKKRYITVKDITEDLMETESRELSRLRDNLIFSGEEEKR